MTKISCIAQPSPRSTLDAVADIFGSGDPQNLDVAAAYVTGSGVRDLFAKIKGVSATEWPVIKKRWLTSFDFCRTEPVALAALLSEPESDVRIYDAEICLKNLGRPRIPFHPKAFLVHGSTKDFALTGSGNLSRSGLRRGVEAGLVIEMQHDKDTVTSAASTLQALNAWFAAHWDKSTPLNTELLTKYEKVFEAAANLGSPTPTDDDIASDDYGINSLNNADLLKLRICRNFWIEGGNITKNRGPNLPGNQLMMKRLSRVFFGFDPSAVPENTLLGSVNMRINGGSVSLYSLSYSDNKMDKLNLPTPGADGPAKYDNEYLLFHRVNNDLFDISLGNAAAKASWIKKSKAIGGAYKMSSGREWGVF